MNFADRMKLNVVGHVISTITHGYISHTKWVTHLGFEGCVLISIPQRHKFNE